VCDFAADAEAAEKLMVGRTLTLERVRQLNAKDYFYQMLKDNPEMLKIYPGIENELLQGAIDCHIHAYPDFVYRSQDMIQVALEASKAGMRAVAFKDHGFPFLFGYADSSNHMSLAGLSLSIVFTWSGLIP